MKRISFWLLSTLSALVLLFGYHTSTSSSLASASRVIASGGTAGGGAISSGSTTSGSGTDPNAARGTTSRGTTSSGTTSNGTTTSKVKDGSYSGATAQTSWGPVQVQIAVTGGKITGVTMLQYPNGNSRDAEINSQALPMLISETTQAQSAQIDMISGATITSGGYLQSLQSALDMAGL